MNNIQRQRWLKDLKAYQEDKQAIDFNIKKKKQELLNLKKDKKNLMRDITKLERRLYGR
jgi:predicted  nucleic acid-binding Zn-ribbon protein